MKTGTKAALLLALVLTLPAACSQKEPVVLLEQEETPEEAPGEIAGETPEGEEAASEAQPPSEMAEEPIWVDICGEVQSPGVYEMKRGQRLYELVEKAGGFTEDAAAMSVNQARLLEDGEQIVILDQETYETAGPGEGAAPGEQEGGKINLNTAKAEELMELTGIGPSKAEAILAYREEKGGFSSIEEITEVSGIGASTFEKIKDDITV